MLLLHGVGSNERDLFSLADQLDERFTVISVRAPIERQPGAYAWFPVEFIPGGFKINTGAAKASRDALVSFLEQIIPAENIDPRQVYLMGFSQGSIMSVYVALTYPEMIRGVVAMSGRLLPEAYDERAPDERLAGLPVYAVHGTEDAVIPISFGRDLRDKLQELPLRFEYHEFAIGHWVTPETLGRISAWLTRELDAGVR